MKEKQKERKRSESKSKVLNKEMKYKLVVHDDLDSVVHCKTVKRKEMIEKQKERKRSESKSNE